MAETTQKKLKNLGLGKGLGALIPKDAPSPEVIATLPVDDGSIIGATAKIDITKVRPNRFQPRQDFDVEALAELSRSIKEKGVIQPITVRRVANGYELVAGERRVRASIEAGLTLIPAYILDVNTDADMLELALIENVQRENLNPIEVALGYQRLIEECNLMQEEVAVKVGKDRSTVTNFLRLLKLPLEVQDALRTKKITMGHARSMLALANAELQVEVLKDVINKELSVRSTEALVKDIELGKISFMPGKDKSASPFKPKPVNNPNLEVKSTLVDIEQQLRTIFSTQVRVRQRSSSGAGTVEIDYYSLEDLERLLDLFVIIERSVMK
ncbi:MAG: ParB/RepB/Spo0J family partition protein [Candidatus Kapabacteria bacterium]|nr:ParB/RepB/Spo0J family partition protein [Candidatus Kapabacteria bacterium]MBX7156336.1 ParB/RepB/Spo0J family partition protein [Bacteroidota bacterium]